MTLQELCWLISITRSILVSSQELWLSPGVSPRLKRRMLRATGRHAKGLAILMRWSDIATCPAASLHRPYWYHAGNQEYRCAMCERLAAWIA
jgi:hypothetical protein